MRALAILLFSVTLFGQNARPLLVSLEDAPNTPVDSPGAGTYSSTQSVTIADATAQFINYTTDGSTPACPATGTLYSGAFNISVTTTLKAIGCNGVTGGGVLTSVYTISSGIAFNAAADLGNNGGTTTSLTTSYTTSSGANRLLLVCIVGDAVSGGTSDIVSVTYNTVSMTQIDTNTQIDRYSYFYYLLAPATGAHNVVITFGSSHYIIAGAADYTGVKQSAQPDASAKANTSSSATLTTTLTTVANNAWTMLCGNAPYSGGAQTMAAGAGSTYRVRDATFGDWTYFDSNAAITPAGSTSMTVDDSVAGNKGQTIMASFSPN